MKKITLSFFIFFFLVFSVSTPCAAQENVIPHEILSANLYCNDYQIINFIEELKPDGAMLYDLNFDRIPEVVTWQNNYTYWDISCEVYSVQNGKLKSVLKFNIDENSPILLYKSKNNSEFYYISECRQYGMANMITAYAEKHSVYRIGFITSNLAGSEIYYSNPEKGCYIYSNSVNGKDIPMQGFFSNLEGEYSQSLIKTS